MHRRVARFSRRVAAAAAHLCGLATYPGKKDGLEAIERRLGWAAGLALIAILACAGRPTPREYFYRLELPAPEIVFEHAPLPGRVLIQRFDGGALYSQRALLYSFRRSPARIQQYHYHHWLEAPTELLAEALAQYLRRASAASTSITARHHLPADYEIAGYIRRFECILDPAPAVIAVELELSVKRNSDEELLWLKTYSAERASTGNKVGEAAEAFAAALAQIFGQFVGDLANIYHHDAS